MNNKRFRIGTTLLLAGMLLLSLAGCASQNKAAENLPAVTIGSDSYPPYNYLDEDGIPTGIDVDLATEAFRSLQIKSQALKWT